MRVSYMALETSRRGKKGLWGLLKGIIFPANLVVLYRCCVKGSCSR